MESKKSGLVSRTFRGAVWSYASVYSGKVLIFLTTIILARLLSKEDFGVAGYALVIISFLNVLNDLGVGPALIYYKDDPDAADTAFWLSLSMGVALFAATWFLAPFVGWFFQDERAVAVTRIAALVFPVGALSNVHDMLLQKGLAFRRKFIPDFAQAAAKGLFSVALSLLNFGAWSLVIGQVAGRAVGTLAYWLISPWRPTRRFSPVLMRRLLAYGLRLVSVNGLGVLLLNADYLFIGYFLDAGALGVYTLAFRIPELVIMQLCYIIGLVIFPAYASMRDDNLAFRRGFLATTQYVAALTVPLGIGLALVAEPFVLTMFSDKWIEAIPVMRAICIYALMISLAYNAGDVYKATGRLNILIRLSLVRAALLIPALWWATNTTRNIETVAWTQAAVALVTGMLNIAVAARMIDTPVRMIAAVLWPILLSGALMGMSVWGVLVALSQSSSLVQLIVSVSVGAVVYVGTLWLIQRNLLADGISVVRTALARS